MVAFMLDRFIRRLAVAVPEGFESGAALIPKPAICILLGMGVLHDNKKYAATTVEQTLVDILSGWGDVSGFTKPAGADSKIKDLLSAP
jgi:hypothetical protein